MICSDNWGRELCNCMWVLCLALGFVLHVYGVLVSAHKGECGRHSLLATSATGIQPLEGWPKVNRALWQTKNKRKNPPLLWIPGFVFFTIYSASVFHKSSISGQKQTFGETWISSNNSIPPCCLFPVHSTFKETCLFPCHVARFPQSHSASATSG